MQPADTLLPVRSADDTLPPGNVHVVLTIPGAITLCERRVRWADPVMSGAPRLLAPLGNHIIPKVTAERARDVTTSLTDRTRVDDVIPPTLMNMKKAINHNGIQAHAIFGSVGCGLIPVM